MLPSRLVLGILGLMDAFLVRIQQDAYMLTLFTKISGVGFSKGGTKIDHKYEKKFVILLSLLPSFTMKIHTFIFLCS